jgi:hypothetical protein
MRSNRGAWYGSELSTKNGFDPAAATGAGVDAVGAATGAQLDAAIEQRVTVNEKVTEACAERVVRALRESTEFFMDCSGKRPWISYPGIRHCKIAERGETIPEARPLALQHMITP